MDSLPLVTGNELTIELHHTYPATPGCWGSDSLSHPASKAEARSATKSDMLSAITFTPSERDWPRSPRAAATDMKSHAEDSWAYSSFQCVDHTRACQHKEEFQAGPRIPMQKTTKEGSGIACLKGS